MQSGIEQGRKTRPNRKMGICGEHGGELSSVKFCCAQGMNYVGCSPCRVPIARLACAQYEVELKKAKKAPAGKKAAPAKKAVAKKPAAKKAPAKKAMKRK